MGSSRVNSDVGPYLCYARMPVKLSLKLIRTATSGIVEELIKIKDKVVFASSK